MPFHFSLQAVLHLRQGLEHQQELRLRAANQQVAKVRHLITQLDMARNESYALQLRQLKAGISGAEIRFHLLRDGAMTEQRRRMEEELARLEKIRDRQREIYQQARREHETLKGLRDQQLDLHRKQSRRREQRRLDDLFLLREQYSRRG